MTAWLDIGLRTLLFYLIPLVVGRGVVKLVGKQSKTESSQAERWLRLPYYFGLGALTLFGLALGVRYGVIGLIGGNFGKIYFTFVGMVIVALVLVNLWKRPKELGLVLRKALVPGLGMLILTILSYCVWLWQNPYPLNWDWYQHEELTRLILSGKFSFLATQLSDTFGFNSYPPLFHLMLAWSQFGATLTPSFTWMYWQAIGFWHTLTVIVVAYGLGWAVSRKKLVAFLAAVLSGLTFDSMVSLTTYFLIPQTLAAVMWAGMLPLLLMAYEGRASVRAWQGWVAVVALGLLHYLVGAVAALIYGGLWLYRVVSERLPKIGKALPWLPLLALIAIGGVLAAQHLSLTGLNHGEAGEYIYSVPKVLEVVERTYGYLAYLLVPLGALAVFVKRGRGLSLVLLIGAGLGLAVFSPIPYSLKLMSLLKFMLVTLMAVGMWLVVERMRYAFFNAVVVLGLVAGTLLILIDNLMYWRGGILVDQAYTHVSDQDVQAATFLYQHYQGSTLMVSDPATQFILEGMSGVDSLGGAYMTVEERKPLLTAFDNQSADELVAAVRRETDVVNSKPTTRLLVISGRTMVWATRADEQRLAFSYNVWSPIDLTLQDLTFIDAVIKVSGVKEVYQAPNLAIFQI